MIRKLSLHFVMAVVVAVAFLSISCTAGVMPTAAETPAAEAIPAATQVVPAPTAEVVQPTAEPAVQPAPIELPQPTDIPTIEPTSTQIPEPTAAPTQEAGTYQAGSVDLDEIFPPGPGKELVLMNCTICHNFVPVVIVGFNVEEWDRNALDHRGRVASMSDADFATLYAYLKEKFGPDNPIPDLPPELLTQWTSY